MEPSSYRHSTAIWLIQVFCGLLVGFLVLGIGLLCFLHINETIDFREGEIYSRNPQTVIRTPTDVRVLKVLAREGDAVRQGDTLFVLENKRVQYDYATTRQEVGLTQNKIAVAERMLAYTRERRAAMERQRTLYEQMYAADRLQNQRELRTLAAARRYAEEQSAISREQYRTDSILHARQALSRLEAAESKSRSLLKRKEAIETRAAYEEKRARQTTLLQTLHQQIASLDIDLNTLKQDEQAKQRELLDLRSQLGSTRNSAVVLGDAANQLIVRAPVAGTILNLYNDRQATELLERNQPLAVIAPKQGQFYAKVILPERELAYVRLGQPANLKINAYYHYKFGPIKGRVSFISSANVNDQFFTIVQLTGKPRFPLKAGYKLKGEIITGKYTLLRYAMKKLFDKIDATNETT
ncbi:HlyD family efflux transporter periplasmic adaptor subunit [Hymenobacter sp. BT770]|uniref:HlyD family efflux transporter periplasmic adaptor subunit n=1 Tax=Hymenobacter sp. BT770 TaxID=2886942 RepID=UPI001D12AFEE|nr:HlyD family efflux transporter periplasmic adaptor subunit [Hymenobacter sp. BT770]MCC3153190.1 HlyD family secretion protein [Hymenobacter sp. BT770]MDO3415336.1 HlyD family efflux transporter periplasmic adaptor subunit [Hymenobacter sp. BT770]